MSRFLHRHFPERRAIASVDADFSDWHRGRRWFALWALWHEDAALAAQLARLHAHCAGLLRPGYARQPHVTLAVRGFCADHAQRPDDFTPQALARDVATLQALNLGAFVVETAGVGSFSMAPFVQLHDTEGGVAALHAALGGRQRPAYVPHWTLGLYGANWPRPVVARRLRRLPPMPRLRLPVTALALLRYDALELSGPLQLLGRYDLARQQFSLANKIPWGCALSAA